MDQIFAPLMICSLTVNTHQLLCSSQRSHREDGSAIHFDSTDLLNLRVTVSAAGNQLSQQLFTLAWTSKEVWGPGCGFCTQAAITVPLPSQ